MKKLHLVFVLLYVVYFCVFIKYFNTLGHQESYDFWIGRVVPILAIVSIILHSILWTKLKKNRLEKIFLWLSSFVAVFFILPYIFPQTAGEIFDFVVKPFHSCGAWGCSWDFFIELIGFRLVIWFIWLVAIITGFVSVLKKKTN